jgi:UDP-glucose 4-epimerase
MPRALITGGAGFMGSHVARECIALGQDVVILDDLSGGFEANVPTQATFIEGDISDVDTIQEIFDRFEFDYIYHLAAYAAEGLSHFIRRFNYENNVLGSANLINAALNNAVKCFVFTSSIAVYGAGQVPMVEDLTPDPEDPYGIAKYAVELDLRAAHSMFGLDYIIFRPHNVYGEAQNTSDRYRNVIGIFMNQILRGEPMTVFGDGEQTRAFSYIGDISPVIARSVDVNDARNRVFNIGADEAYTVNELAQTVARALGVEAEVDHLPPRNEVVHAYSSHERVREVFGVLPTTPLEEGIARMAEWVQQIGPRSPSGFGTIEVTRNLPPSWKSASPAS